MKQNPAELKYKEEVRCTREVLNKVRDYLPKIQEDMYRAVKESGINIGLANRYTAIIDETIQDLNHILNVKIARGY